MYEKIKAELLKRIIRVSPPDSDFNEGRRAELRSFYDFIESLEKESIPEWCGYPKELRCMSLANGYVNGEEFCKTCDAYKGKKGYDESYLQEKIAKAKKSWEGVDADKFMDEVRGREPEIKGWVAREKDGSLFLFSEIPTRYENEWVGSTMSRVDHTMFPDLKWEDEPRECELTINLL